MKKIFFFLAIIALFTMCNKSADTKNTQKETTKFYRIKQVDKDGKISYSTVKMVKK